MRPPTIILPVVACLLAAVAGYHFGSVPAAAGPEPGARTPTRLSAIQLDPADPKDFGKPERVAMFADMDIGKLARRAKKVACSHWENADLSALLVFAERDPEGALALAQSPDCLPWAKFQLLNELLNAAALEGISSVEAFLEKLENPDELMSRLGSWGPHFGFATLTSLMARHTPVDSRGEEWNPLARHFRSWAVENPKAAIAGALALPEGLTRRAAMLGLLAGWAGEDPAAAAAWLEEQNDPWLSRKGSPIVVRRANESSHKDAEAITSRLGTANGGSTHNERAQFGSLDPLGKGPAAFAATGTGNAGTSMRKAIVGRMAQKDPAAALALVATLPQGRARADLIDAIFASNHPDYLVADPAEAFKLLEDPIDRRAAIEAIFSSPFGLIDPQIGAELLSGLENLDWFADNIARHAQVWSSTDLDASRAWIESLPQGAARDAANLALLPTLAMQDPTAALALADSIDSESVRLKALSDLGFQRAFADEAGVLAWARGNVPEGAARDAVISGALRTLANNSQIEQAVAGFDQLMTPGSGLADNDQAGRTANLIADQWSDTAPADAAQWITNLPEGSVRTGAAEILVDQWLRRDPVEASQWIADLPPGPTRDASTEKLVASILRDDPESALRWAASITDPTQRLESAEATLRHWSRFDPQAAWQATEEFGLSASDIETLATRLGR